MSESGRRVGTEEDEDEEMMRRGPWLVEEDNILIGYVTRHGEGRWNCLAKSAGLKRSGKSCRLRWLNYLKPNVKRGNLTPHEQLLILELHSQLGNRWSKIAQHLPGRTDNEIKNYWRTRVQKQARQLKLDSDSEKFVEAINSFWKPRLLEKMKQDSNFISPSSSSSSNNTQFEITNHTSIHHAEPVSSLQNDGGRRDEDLIRLYSVEDIIGKIPCNDVLEPGSEHDHSFPRCHTAGLDWFEDELGYFLEH